MTQETTELELKQATRVLQVEEVFWRFFTVYRRHLADCEANQRMLEAELESRLLPISFENLETVWVTLPDPERAKYAPGTGEIKPRQPERTVEEVTAQMADIARELGDVEKGILPEEMTPRVLEKMDKDEYRKLIKKFGMAAINARLEGRN